uniref:CSON014371 protein n=1 Tax=Culicoides sonorensis TaxID=179676 RepID=A0A336MEE5_CULSO
MRVHTSMRQLKKRIKKKNVTRVERDEVLKYSQAENFRRLKPPQYKMPPQPIMQHYNESQLPGAATETPHNLRTHSSKFPIERELILSSDNKNASKMSLGLHQFLPKMPGSTSVAPDTPVKHQVQAWNQINHQQMDQIHSQMALTRPTQMPEDVTALVERDNYNKDSSKDNGKNAVSKTYHTIKDIISSKFKKDQVTAGSLDELNNATSFQQQIVQQQRISPYAIKKPRPDEMLHQTYNGQVPRPNTDSPIYLQSSHINSQQYINAQIQSQKALSQPHLNYEATYVQSQSVQYSNERRASIDNVEVTDSDDGGFINKNRRSARNLNETPCLTPNAQSYYEKQKTPQFSGYRPQSMLEHVNEKRLTEMHNNNGNESGRESRNNIIENSRKQATPINNTSDYEKGEHFSSNVDSGRESLAYTPASRNQNRSAQSNGTMDQNIDGNDSEWVDVIDAELKHILEPGMKDMCLNKDQSKANSISSASPSLPNIMGPPPRPVKSHQQSMKNDKMEYGTDSYNRVNNISKPIAPSKGYPSTSLQQKRTEMNTIPMKKQVEQSLLKRHLFGLDVDMTSTTTRSFDLESLLGIGQSVSDSETDTNGLRNIKYQLEGLENMYSEVLKMLKGRRPQMGENSSRGMSRRRYGSISSLPSSSVSGRPIRDKKRIEERRKIRDIKGINKRFQRLESHVVTLARSVAHLSSEMRSQHLVTQEIEMLKNDIANLRTQNNRTSMFFNGNQQMTIDRSHPEPPNLTNPKRVKKLTKFFGDDPPLLRLFLRKLGYEKYAQLFEKEKVGMIELPYLSEERLQKMGVPLGPRLRILQEAQISLCKDTTLCIL